MPTLTRTYEDAVPLDQLTPHPRNPRKHSAALAASIRANGFADVVIAWRPDGPDLPGQVLSGHGRLEVLAEDGETTAPVIWLEGVEGPDHALRILLAINRAGDLATNDDALLVELLTELGGDDLPTGLDGTGYDDEDLAGLVAELDRLERTPAPTPEPSDDTPSPPVEPVTVRGDVWLLGPHRICCGDARTSADVERLLAGAELNIAFTSPPYADRRKYDETTGFQPIPPEGYADWLAPTVDLIGQYLAADGGWFLNIRAGCYDGQRDLYVHDLVATHVREWGWLFVDDFCWVDTNDGVPGGWPNRFKDAWEPVFHFARQTSIKFRPWANASEAAFDYSTENGNGSSSTGSGLLSGVPAGVHDGVARPSNVVQICAGGAGARETGHSAVFPVELPQWFIRAFTDPGDRVYDPFIGAGSTLLAAEREDRICLGMELSPAYCDVICARYQRRTGTLAVLEATGEPHDFGELAALQAAGGAWDGQPLAKKATASS